MRYLVFTVFLILVGVSTSSAQVDSSKMILKEEPIDHDEFIPSEIEPVAIDTLTKLLVYPETARQAGIEGDVEISALIGRDGRVMRAKIERSSNFVFDKAAKDAMYKMRYRPATSGGTPVSFWIMEKIQFRLPKDN